MPTPRAATAALLLAAALCPSLARAATPAPPPGEGTPQRQPFGTGPGGCALEIAAGPGSVLDKDELVLKDYVDIKCGDLRLQADLVRYTPSTHEAHAEGNVVLDQARVRITADSIDYNLETSTGQFFNARGYAEPSILFEAARIEQTSPEQMVLHDATFTACTQPTPYWSFKLGRGVLELGDYAYLHHLSFKLGKATIFYTPYLVWPIKTDRASGLLFPEFGFSERSGTILSQAWYWAIGRSLDTTFYFDYMSESGYGFGNEFRYKPSETGRGQFTGYYIRDQVAKEENQPGVPTDRWSIDYAHQQQLDPEWRFVTNMTFISDFDYFLDFERDIRVSSNPQALSKAYLTRNWGFNSLNIWAERREQLVQDPIIPTAYGQPIIAFANRTFVRWTEPEIEFRTRRRRIGDSPLFFTLESSVDYFDKGDRETVYGRGDLYPVISSQLSPVPWIDIDANAGLRDTFYTKSQRLDLGCDNVPDTGDFGEGNGLLDSERDNAPLGIFGAEDDLGCDNLPATGDFGEGNNVRDLERTLIFDDSFDRRIYQAGLNLVGPKLSRIFDTPKSDFSPQYKNSIEPTLRYAYFSEVQDPLNIILFDDIDTLAGNTNRVTYGLSTRLYAKRPALGISSLGFPMGPVGGAGSSQDALAHALERIRPPTPPAGEEPVVEGGTQPGAPKDKKLSTVEIASFEITQDYSFLGPLSASVALDEQRPVSPVMGTLRVNPSINTSVDLRTSFDVLFKEIRDASLSANLRSPGRGFLDFTWSISRDLEGKALQEQGVAFTNPFNRSQLGVHGEGVFFQRKVLLGFQANYELGDLLPGEPRFRDQRYRAGYNTQCCGFQFEYLNRNFVGSDLTEFRFLVNLRGVGNVVDLHQRVGAGG
ncbi:MAG TPA: LPS assembly protein LptD [Candidatus Polarisedimenticolia bacterium]|nr:LPS assembly protein LptD [Candidatus Polarisedimenticolia bacterium]